MNSTAIIWGAVGGALGGVVGVFFVQFAKGFISGLKKAKLNKLQSAGYKAELERQTRIIEEEEASVPVSGTVNPRPFPCMDPNCMDDRPHDAHTTFLTGDECKRTDCFDMRPHRAH